MQRICRSLESTASISSMEIQKEDSIQDIQYYIQSRTKGSPTDSGGNISVQEDLTESLLRRSNACFLWVRLVLDELEEVYSNDGMAQALNGIPEGMVPYYERTVRSMAEKKERHISSAVLMWVVASLQKLTIQELACALEWDIKAVLPNALSAVEGLCGQLVSVDDHSGAVELVHSTAREFLLSEPAAPFTVVRPQAHERIALTCLDLLCSTEMQPPRSRRQLSTQKPKTSPPPALLDYAIHQFSEHVYMASSETDQLLIRLDRLFRTNILSWIEAIARQGSLHPLIRVSKNLKSYLDRRAKYLSPLRAEVQNLDAWSTDLSRLATKYGPALLENPTSVYFLNPPLCPSGSAIHQRFAKRLDGLAVVGHIESAWDDCTASVGFGEDSTASAASSGQCLISVGMESGDIELFDSHSFQKVAVVQAKAPVDQVHLTDKGIAACTTKTVLLMTREGQVLWSTRLRFRCMLLTSTDRAVVAVSQHGHVLQWDISTGALLEDQAFTYRKPDDGEGVETLKAPHVASISADTDMLALGYRAGAVCIFDMASGELVCWARDDQNRLVSVLLFNPNPRINLLLVIFRDHELALYDTFSGGLVGMQATPSTAGVLSACCSSEGRTLATMDTHGVLKIWDFETLNLLYHVSTPTTSFSILNFTPDASEIVDVLDSGMRLWGPAALVRKTNEEDQSISEEAAHLPPIEGEYEIRRASKITALCAHPALSLVLVGKQDGQVMAFNTKTGTRIAVLYTHAHGAGVTELVVNKNSVAASSDHNGIMQVWDLGAGQLPGTLDDRRMRFAAYSTSQIRQICFSASGELLLLATEQFDRIYSSADGSCLGTIDFRPEERGIWRWLEDPTAGQGETFYLLSSHTLTKYGPAARKVDDSVVQLEIPAVDDAEAAGIDSATTCPSTRTLAVSVRYLSGYVSSSDTFLFDLSGEDLCALHLDDAAQLPSLPISPLSNDTSRYWKQFLSVDDRAGKFVFLHQNSWVCSADLTGLAQGQFTQHFFVPTEYVSTTNEILPVRSADNGIVFGLDGELTIVKNGFNFGRTRTFS